jgi:(1->4)-alpha-D-glucan 1-alpha-D-glucosylmutase
VPGVPDLYQGTEAIDLSLVDPDNRRPVNYARLQANLDGEPLAKMALIQRLLTLRRDHPALFATSGYDPIAVTGARADQVIAFRRVGDRAVLRCVVPLRTAECHLDGIGVRDWWGDTALASGERLADLVGDRSVSIELLPATG